MYVSVRMYVHVCMYLCACATVSAYLRSYHKRLCAHICAHSCWSIFLRSFLAHGILLFLFIYIVVRGKLDEVWHRTKFSLTVVVDFDFLNDLKTVVIFKESSMWGTVVAPLNFFRWFKYKGVSRKKFLKIRGGGRGRVRSFVVGQSELTFATIIIIITT